METLTRSTILVLGAIAVAIACGAPSPARQSDAKSSQSPPNSRPTATVRAYDLGRAVQVIGPLDEPLGKLLTIEGRPVPPSQRLTYWEANIAENLFSVERVNGKKLNHSAWLELRLAGREPLGEGYATFRGYQTGGFAGEPQEAIEDEAKRAKAEGAMLTQRMGWVFQVQFVVIDRRRNQP